MNILIVEDEELAVKKLQKTLAAVDPDANVVAITDSIKSTIEWLEENASPDLILMDINMPQMDGMTCAREIRKSSDPVIAKVPIIAITGNARNYSESDFSDAGFNDFLPKPLDFDKLVELVKTYIA